MKPLIFYALVFVLGCWAGVMRMAHLERQKRLAERRAQRTEQVQIQSSATQREVTLLQFAFADYLEERGGLAEGEHHAEVFADWLANLLQETVVVRQVDGPGIAIAMPDQDE